MNNRKNTTDEPLREIPEGWYAITPVKAIKAKKINAFNLCGRSLLVTLEGTVPVVFDRACPHMGIDLVKGKISKNGQILCPYHNEPFCKVTGDYTGETFKTPMRLHQYPAKVSYDWVWFYNGSQPKYDLPSFSATHHDFSWQRATVTARMDNMMLNALDALHFVSLHKGLLSAKDRFYEVEAVDDYVFKCHVNIDKEARGYLNLEAMDRIVYGPSVSVNGVKLGGSTRDYRILTFRPQTNGKTEIVMINCIQKNRPSTGRVDLNIPSVLKPLVKLVPPRLFAAAINTTLFFQDSVVTRNIISNRRMPDAEADQPAIHYLRVYNRLRPAQSAKVRIGE
jgi:nitrite reductase/ring-hydroxylating ferredoxin subunit